MINEGIKNTTDKEFSDSLIEYPCDFPLKVFGKQHAEFPQAVLAVISKFDPNFIPASMEIRTSKTARYTSLTCTVQATSRIQLDAIYQALCDHPMVVMVL
jgi:putative lipoic acid-binding regulatory protein